MRFGAKLSRTKELLIWSCAWRIHQQNIERFAFPCQLIHEMPGIFSGEIGIFDAVVAGVFARVFNGGCHVVYANYARAAWAVSAPGSPFLRHQADGACSAVGVHGCFSAGKMRHLDGLSVQHLGFAWR